MVPFIITFFKRLRSGSPEFFVKLRIGMIILGVLIIIAQLLLANNIITISNDLEELLTKIFTEALVVISTVTGVSFLPTKDADLIDNDVKSAVLKKALEENDEVIANNSASLN